MPDEPYQSLYRRFRPGRFDGVLGQGHVTAALRNAVATDKIGHAYLFSGPRGTGKTSTARILAKALNCASPEGGEPCGVCDSCTAVATGSSLDVHELDAASHNGVDAMRDLVSRAALATPGRWKVYIIDEVHMLSTAASNALLKTLEEPPGQVLFVLATTDPQKVLPTIRSRTQHFEFHLLGPDILEGLVEQVARDAGIDMASGTVPSVVRRARGSARDALSALDQASAAGVFDDASRHVEAIVEAVHSRDGAAALAALDSAIAAGRDPQVLAVEMLEQMRQAFLATFAPDLAGRHGFTPGPDAASGRGGASGSGGASGPDAASGSGGASGPDAALGPASGARPALAALVRTMEVIGRAQVDMRSAVDPRITLEVALVRLARPDVDVSPEAILERVEKLEGGGGLSVAPSPAVDPGAPAAGRSRAPAPQRSGGPAAPAPQRSGIPAAPARSKEVAGGSALQALQERYGSSANEGSRPTGAYPTRDELTKVWGDGLLASLSTKARARFKVGRFVAGEEGTATFALPNEVHLEYCGEILGEVQSALTAHFGSPVELVLVVDPDPSAVVDVLGGSESSARPVNGSAPGRPRSRTAGPPSTSPPTAEVDAENRLTAAELSPEAMMSDPSQLLTEQEVAARAASLLLEHFPGAVEVTEREGAGPA